MKKLTLRLKKSIKKSKVVVVYVVGINHKFLLIKWQEGKTLLKMLNVHTGIDQLWVKVLGVNYKNCTVLKLHDMCHNPKCKCQKQITFTPKQYMLEGNAFKNTMKKTFRGSQRDWSNFLKPAIQIATPNFPASVAAKTRSPESAQITNNILKSLTGGKILSLTDMQGKGLRLKVMWNLFKYSLQIKWVIVLKIYMIMIWLKISCV